MKETANVLTDKPPPQSQEHALPKGGKSSFVLQVARSHN